MLIGKSLIAAHRLSRTQHFRLSGVFLFCWILFFVTYASMNTTMETAGYVLWFACGVTCWLLNQNNKLNDQTLKPGLN
jgi:hypothetical protein